MDWSIQPFSKKSAASGECFEAGETVVSLIYKDDTGLLQRMDLKDHEISGRSLPPRVLGRWTHAVKAKQERSQEKQEHLQSAEALFLSLFEEDPEGQLSQGPLGPIENSEALDQDKAILKLILALMLERKRMLKPITAAIDPKELSYIHVRSQRAYAIRVIDYTVQDLERMKGLLKTLL